MDNQHKQIKGYRDLSQEEIDLMNEIKSVGERLQNLCEKVIDHEFELYDKLSYDKYTETYGMLDRNLFWADSGSTDLQVGLMKLTRAVAKPTTF
jgi:hypothetical protein